MPRAAPRVAQFRPTLKTSIPDIEAAISALTEMGVEFETAIKSVTERHRLDIEQKLRSETNLAYTRGTGRFSRGIQVRAQTSTTEKFATASLTTTLPGYRETRFLTNVSGQGRFKFFPVTGYFIYARGLKRGGERLFDDRELPPTGSELRRVLKLARRRSKGRRLSVPTDGLVSFIPEGKKLESQLASTGVGGFYYPLWVKHLGFPRDVVSEVLEREGFDYTQEMLDKTTGEMINIISRYQTLTFHRGSARFKITQVG